jgi:NADH-quinone oxidoreductase subunit I
MKAMFRELYSGCRSLVTGMRITLQQFFKPQVTVHYPRETLRMPERYRGHIELVRDPQTGLSLCIACKSCEKACPSDCIAVDGVKKEGDKRKSATDFKVDFTKCSLCGSCVEVCPTDALRFSRRYNLASTSREAYYLDLLQRLQSQPQTQPQPEKP